MCGRGVLAYQNTIIPKPSAKESFYMGILTRQAACVSFESGGNSRTLNINSWGSACTCLQSCDLESLSMPHPKWKQQKLAADSCPLNMGCSFGNHLWPLPLWLQVSGDTPWYGLSCFTYFLTARNVCSILQIKMIKLQFLFSRSQETRRGPFFQSCHKDPL